MSVFVCLSLSVYFLISPLVLDACCRHFIGVLRGPLVCFNFTKELMGTFGTITVRSYVQLFATLGMFSTIVPRQTSTSVSS